MPDQNPTAKKRGRIWPVVLILFLIVCVVIYTQLTIFVVQPIGAVPEGRTLIIARMNKTQFIDSADAMCERIQNGVSLLCRMAVMGAVLKNTTVLMRLPYSETLYLISTGGKTYDR